MEIEQIEQYDVRVRVVSQTGFCIAGHKVGDEFVMHYRPPLVPTGLCAWAFDVIFPYATALRFGGRFPWLEAPWHGTPDKYKTVCSDAANPVVFEIERISNDASRETT